MKQTNNAIKFLMAQYRAIFKNANIAMVAAIAAAALAAGQAQAAPLNTTDQWTGLKGNELTAGGSSDSFETITLVWRSYEMTGITYHNHSTCLCA